MCNQVFFIPIFFKTDIPVLKAITSCYESNFFGYMYWEKDYHMKIVSDHSIIDSFEQYNIDFNHWGHVDDIATAEFDGAAHGITEKQIYEHLQEKVDYANEHDQDILCVGIAEAVSRVIEDKGVVINEDLKLGFEEFAEKDEDNFHDLICTRMKYYVLDFKSNDVWCELLIELSSTCERVAHIIELIKNAERKLADGVVAA